MWDKRYSGEAFAFGTEPNDFVRDHAGRLPIGDTLSIGEGEGRNAVFLAGLGHKVLAMDASKVGLDKAQGFAARHGVKIEVHHDDLATYQLGSDNWDVIISIFCHLPEALRKQVHGQIAMPCAPVGALFLRATHHYNWNTKPAARRSPQ